MYSMSPPFEFIEIFSKDDIKKKGDKENIDITKEEFIKYTNELGIMTRPSWYPMHMLPIFSDHLSDDLKNNKPEDFGLLSEYLNEKPIDTYIITLIAKGKNKFSYYYFFIC